jgi:hypothetical protein
MTSDNAEEQFVKMVLVRSSLSVVCQICGVSHNARSHCTVCFNHAPRCYTQQIVYSLNGQQVQEMAQVSNFPRGY